MIVRVTEWMGARWWAALVIVLAFILVARTGTVDAPTHAKGIEHGPAAMPSASAYALDSSGADRAILQQHVRRLEGELAVLRLELDAERERAALLASGYEALESRFDRVTDAVQSMSAPREASATLAPKPIEAIHVRGLDAAAERALKEQQR
ncbi:MAG: hypothetical protein AAF726_16755 [Planctomycetota bacterium]